ncbi:MAG TPA: DUF2085 domain-containing protein [Thermoplasmata archaeon]|nr:DUF2085 domain-containing protein [Thermoplasmata archaeon]
MSTDLEAKGGSAEDRDVPALPTPGGPSPSAHLPPSDEIASPPATSSEARPGTHPPPKGRGRRRHLNAMAITAGFFLFYLGSIVTAPLFLAPDTVDFGENGLSGKIDFEAERQNASMTGFIYWLYWEGDMNHHQKASRSYFVNGNEMPQDTRDLGIYAGIAIALMWSTRRMYRVKAWGLLLGLVPIGLDGGVQLLTNFVTINPFRVFTGFLCGLTVGFAFASIYFDSLAPRDIQTAQRDASRMSDEEKVGGAGLKKNPVGPALLLLEPVAKRIWKVSGLERGDREFFALCVFSMVAVVAHILLFVFAGVQLYRSGW